MPEANDVEQEQIFSEESYRSIIETIEDGYYEVDLFGRFTAFNHALPQIMGYPADDLLGKSYEAYTDAETAELVRSAFRQVYETKEPVRSFIWQIFHQDGRMGYVETSISPIQRNSKVVGFRGIARDVTNQRQIEEIFEQTEKTYRKTAVGASSFVFQFLLTTQGKATFPYISEAARNLLEISREQLQLDAAHLLKFIHPEHAATLQKQLAESAQKVEAFQWEGIFYLPSGQERWFQTTSYPEKLANGDTLWYGFWTDITAQRAAQAASQRTETVLRAMVEGTVSQVGEGFFRSLVKQLAQALQVEHAFVTQFDAIGGKVSSLAFWSDNKFQDNIEYPMEGTPCQQVLADRFCVYEDEVQRLFPTDQKLSQLNARSYLGIPLHGSQGEVLGHLVVLDRAPMREEELRRSVLQVFAARAGSELQQRLNAEKLAKQAADLETVAEISTAVAATRDTQQLLQDVVDLTRLRFSLYHAHIYLLDEPSQTLVLTAGAGKVGRLMVAEGRVIPINQEQSLVAQAARTHQGIIANEVQQNPHFLSHPLLPYTQSEMAVPLLIGTKLLGVLDVQADQIGRFTPQDLNIQTTLASQVAVALENARSFEESEKAQRELNQLTRRLTREGWENYLERSGQAEVGYSYASEPNHSKVPAEEETAVSSLTVPLTIQGEEIGQLSLAEPQILTEDANDIIQAVAERLTAHIENLRLSDQTHFALAEAERQARNLAVINQVAQTVSQQIEPTTLLGTVYEQLQQVMAADAFMVALYDRGSHTIEFPVIYDEGITYSTPPAPPSPFSNFYKAVQTRQPLLINRTAQEIEERRNRVQKNEMIGNEEKISASLLYVPMQIGREIIGALSVQSYKLNAYTDADVSMLLGIANHVAVALENARLFAQTQAALTETELLYNVSAKLNAATTLEEVLQAVTIPAIQAGAAGAVLYRHETGQDGKPEWAWAAASTKVTVPLNVRFQLSPAWGELLFSESGNVILIEDFAADARLDEETKTTFQSMNVLAAVVLPLAVGSRWTGAIMVQWETPHSFTAADQRLYTVLSAQASVAADSLLLFAQTQQRAAQLQKLAQLEVSLSQADSEDQIIQALLDVIDQGKVGTASLSYFHEDGSRQPRHMDLVSIWAGGEFLPEITRQYENIPLEAFPISHLWQQHPGEALIVTDAESDPRLDEAMRQQAAGQGWKAAVLIPLRTSGQWQGMISVNWMEVYEPSAEELFIFREVLEPASAVVGTRRAQIAQRQALAETETLYKATAQLNLAQSYDDIVTALRKHTILGHHANYITLDYFDHPWTTAQKPEMVDVLGLWGQLPVEHLPRHYAFANMPIPITLLRPDAPTVIENMTTDTRLEKATCTFYRLQYQANSTILVPLVVGGQWIGVANAMYPEETAFSEVEIRRLVAIASQAAVAVQTIRLLEETNRLLASEQSQRRIADTLVRAARHMTGTLQEKELRQLIVREIEDILKPDQINMYEWGYHINQLRLNVRWLATPTDAEDDYRVDQVVPAADRPDLYQVLRENRPLLEAKNTPPYIREHYRLPWYIGTEVAGVVEIYHTARHLTIREEDQARCEGVVRQAAVAMQSARLFEQEQQRARREQVLREIAAKVRSSADVDSIMRTAVQEIGRALGRRTYVYLDAPPDTSQTELKEPSYEG